MSQQQQQQQHQIAAPLAAAAAAAAPATAAGKKKANEPPVYLQLTSEKRQQYARAVCMQIYEIKDEQHKTRFANYDIGLVYTTGELFPAPLAEQIREILMHDIEYQADCEAAFRKKNKQGAIVGTQIIPRKQALFGNFGTSVMLNGARHCSRSYPRVVAAIKNRVEEITGETFNMALVTLFKDGWNSMGFVKENEPEEYDKQAVYALVSFGCPRRFELLYDVEEANRRDGVANPYIKRRTLTLNSGSLLSLHPPTNEKWFHSIPRTHDTQPTVAITFRRLAGKFSKLAESKRELKKTEHESVMAHATK